MFNIDKTHSDLFSNLHGYSHFCPVEGAVELNKYESWVILSKKKNN